MPNRLAQETSPYLLQHKDNPVDWYPWGPEALSRARAENKPILLSVGYSACHWCHVMAHESFENPQIASVMNERFVNIKVDREERPDLDQIYQNVAQALTHSGGWPLTVFLTPDLRPFFGGTYFPPEDRWGRPGFPRLLAALSDAYANDPQSVAHNAEKLTEFIQSLEAVQAGGKREPTRVDLEKLAEQILSITDWENGGMNGAPKFPNVMAFAYLWRLGEAFGNERCKEATLLSLRKMYEGGIYDQLGGGFHRYSVDETWSVPHFEKMLYDNALLLKLYSEVILSDDPLVTQELRTLFTTALKETVQYLFREMRSADGCFFAAQDADSEGEEGKFFVWDLKDLEAYLDPMEREVFALRYGVSEAGNFEHGKTVLYASMELDEVAAKRGISVHDAETVLASARTKLLAARSRRTAPGTDDKVLVSWNGLMISGLAWAAQALAQEGQGELGCKASGAARSAFDFIHAKLSDPEGRLKSTFQKGEARFNAYLDDYAFLAKAALDLARFTSRSEEIAGYLSAAQKWIDRTLKHFKDAQGGGYFFTSDDHESLIQRPKTIYDQAIPSGTSYLLECLAALAEVDWEGRGGEYEAELSAQLPLLFEAASKNPYACGELLSSALLHFMGPVVVSGPEAWKLVRNELVFQKPDSASLGKILICHRRACGTPANTVSQARSELRSKLRTENN